MSSRVRSESGRCNGSRTPGALHGQPQADSPERSWSCGVSEAREPFESFPIPSISKRPGTSPWACHMFRSSRGWLVILWRGLGFCGCNAPVLALPSPEHTPVASGSPLRLGVPAVRGSPYASSEPCGALAAEPRRCGGSGCPSSAIVAVGVPYADPVFFVVNHMLSASEACFHAPCDDGGFLAAKGTPQPILFAVDLVSPPAVSVDGMHESFCQRRSPFLELATPDGSRAPGALSVCRQ